MSSKRMNLGSRDLISSLPDCLICHILSFLSTKEAAYTSVLAKRWRYLFALTPNLHFDDNIYLNPETVNRRKNLFPLITDEKSEIPRSFVDFVDRVLVLHHNVPINRFSLKCEDVVHPAIVIGWLLKVLDRGVTDLDLQISSELKTRLPSEMFVNETLVRLKIGIEDVLTISKVKCVSLPKLKTLWLEDVLIKNSAFARLLSGCPVLEELILNNWLDVMLSYYVSHNTLKRLLFGRSVNVGVTHKLVSFSTPNLVYLEYTDTIADKYPKVHFNSLVEARIDLRMTDDQIVEARSSDDVRSTPVEMVGNATSFLMGICNVKILYLSANTLEVLTYCCKPMPEFNNLIHLTIKTGPNAAWDSLPALFKNCPKLETLVFEVPTHIPSSAYTFFQTKVDVEVVSFTLQGLHHRNIYCVEEDGCLCQHWDYPHPTRPSSSPVKVLKILKFGKIFRDGDMEDQIKQVQHFLETMPNLEQLILYYDTSSDKDVNEVSTNLQRHPRVASSKCKVSVMSDNLCLSSTVPCLVTTKMGCLL